MTDSDGFEGTMKVRITSDGTNAGTRISADGVTQLVVSHFDLIVDAHDPSKTRLVLTIPATGFDLDFQGEAKLLRGPGT